jgi:uncharacterized protein YecT (DUF1311 family)
MLPRTPLALACAALAFAATAKEPVVEDGSEADSIEIEYAHCIDAAGAMDFAMAACAYTAEEAWDARMNAAYRKLLDVLDADARDKQREAQRRWVAFRDAEFEAIAARNGTGGTLDGVLIAGERLALVKRRALDLAQSYAAATL